MNVLLVEADEGERFRLSEALERQGCRVMSCPGPLGPDYTCVGGRSGRCPLSDPADVIVLDLCLTGDDLIMGTAALELVGLYVSSGRPVVALGRSVFARDLSARSDSRSYQVSGRGRAHPGARGRHGDPWGRMRSSAIRQEER
jgi:hypothetical protein